MGSAEPELTVSAEPVLTTRGQVISRLKEALERSLAGGGNYSELDVETLAKEAGLSRSSFYVYFESKVELIREIADDVITGVIDLGSSWWELSDTATKSDLRAALERMHRAYRAQAALVGVFVEATAYDPRIREEYQSLVRRSRRRIEEHIREGQARGAVRAGIDPDTTATWLTALLSRGSHELIRTAAPTQFGRRITALTDIIWATLYEGTR
ncbi:MAG TPA: TetR/AcrR family transcriptional regulator [Pseudonocardia sp.]|jgi:AcrR family transcriptional regulator